MGHLKPVFNHIRYSRSSIIILRADRAALRWTLSRALISFFKTSPKLRFHIPASDVLEMYKQFLKFTFSGQFQKLRCIIPNDLFSLVAIMETRSDHLSFQLMVTPRYERLSTCSNSTPQKTYFLWGGLFGLISVSGQLRTYPSPNPTCYNKLISQCYYWVRGGVGVQLPRHWYWSGCSYVVVFF